MERATNTQPCVAAAVAMARSMTSFWGVAPIVAAQAQAPAAPFINLALRTTETFWKSCAKGLVAPMPVRRSAAPKPDAAAEPQAATEAEAPVEAAPATDIVSESQAPEAQAEEPEVATEAADAPEAPAPETEDDLSQITGIGPATARKLQDENIRSFAQIAAMTPEDLNSVVKKANIRLIKYATTDWIKAAKKLIDDAA